MAGNPETALSLVKAIQSNSIWARLQCQGMMGETPGLGAAAGNAGSCSGPGHSDGECQALIWAWLFLAVQNSGRGSRPHHGSGLGVGLDLATTGSCSIFVATPRHCHHCQAQRQGKVGKEGGWTWGGDRKGEVEVLACKREKGKDGGSYFYVAKSLTDLCLLLISTDAVLCIHVQPIFTPNAK